MTITVQFFSYFKELTGIDELSRDVPDGCTLGKLRDDLCSEYSSLQEMCRSTLLTVLGKLRCLKPSSLHTSVFLDKPAQRKRDTTADYFGFGIPDEFVVGYGLDYAERFRNLPYIGVLKPEVYGT